MGKQTLAASLPFDLPGFQIIEVRPNPEQLEIFAASLATSAHCSVCQSISQKIHSHYTRHPRDLPCQEQTIRLYLQVHRFFCENLDCPRHIFVEPIPAIVPKYARRTNRFTTRLVRLGLALGGEAGARLGKQIGIPTSGDTILRVLHRLPIPNHPSPRVVGIDDWAWLKGVRYGTILCDLERGDVIDLLPDTEAETVTGWLKSHSSIEIISRDRSTGFADAQIAGIY